MEYGHFDDPAREYVITRPDTPWPWMNYLGCEEFFSLVSNAAGGYSFYKDARMRRLTRYRYNDVPQDGTGRWFYVKDGETVWNPGWRPTRTPLDSYECRHGLGYTRIRGSKAGIEAELLLFVPLGATCEIQRLTLRNTTGGRRHLSLFSLTEFCLWNALDDMTNFQRNFSTGEVVVDGSTIYNVTEHRERRDHFSFYHVDAPTAGFETDRAAFTGPHAGYAAPEAVARGRLAGTVASGWSPIASHWIELDLGPGEERGFTFMLGYVENPAAEKWSAPGRINTARAKALIARFDSPGKVEAELARLARHWEDLLGRYTVQSSEPRLDRMVNVWNQYQCMATFNLARSASFFESGIGRGIGFRDTNQDSLGCMHQVPERVRQRLVDVASTQFEDGSAYHQFQPLTKRGNADAGSNFNDDPLWLILATAAYVKETGDMAFLEEPVPFNHDPSKARPLFDHLQQSFRHVTDNLGPHGLPLIGGADWNDCLNLNCFSTDPNQTFQTTLGKDGRTAESVLIAGMFVFIGREYVEICRRTGREAEAREALRAIAAMETAVLAHGWDGEWFLRAYDDFGAKIGSKECRDGKIFIESNGFCSMAGIGAERGFPRAALDSVKEHLDTPYGIELFTPPYREYHVELGEISSYPPGYKENGGIFCHSNPWVVIAECIAGRADQAFEYYRQTSPGFREAPQELYRLEPYVYAQMVASRPAPRYGEAKNSWLTGTAAWTFVALSQWILGVRPDWEGLRIEPRLPKGITEARIQRRFRGCTYSITVRNAGRPAASRTFLVDGAPSPTTVVPPGPAGSTRGVLIEM
jgi:cellobiose phosphorylase